jgi:hypothetical protein
MYFPLVSRCLIRPNELAATVVDCCHDGPTTSWANEFRLNRPEDVRNKKSRYLVLFPISYRRASPCGRFAAARSATDRPLKPLANTLQRRGAITGAVEGTTKIGSHDPWVPPSESPPVHVRFEP